MTNQPVTSDAATDCATRAHILRLVVAQGPVTAGEIASELRLASAGIRRHLGELEAGGLIEQHPGPTPAPGGRGRGRPARYFVASSTAHRELKQGSDDLAVEAIEYLAQAAGPGAVGGLARQRAQRLEQRYTDAIGQAGPGLEDRITALAAAMNADGYAATVRPGPRGLTLQLCQGHCPVHRVARVFPQFCEAETDVIGRLLGVHVQRLATLASGEHVCTTCVPVALELAPAGSQAKTGTSPMRREGSE